MLFVINMKVIYRPEDGSMWPSGDEGSAVILTLTMNRLLSYLLERRGQLLTRNGLLDNIWDAHGLRSSSHTLNKYITELRKHFMHFGVDEECIITVPRVGFMFSSDIDVKNINQIKDGDCPPSQGDLLYENNENKFSRCKIKLQSLKNKYISLRLCYIYAISIFIISVIAFTFLRPKFTPGRIMDDVRTNFLFNYETCQVYTIKANSETLSEKKITLFLELVEREGISCLNGTSFLYQVSDSYLYGQQGRAFISRCTLKGKGYISCLSYYWSGHESKV